MTDESSPTPAPEEPSDSGSAVPSRTRRATKTPRAKKATKRAKSAAKQEPEETKEPAAEVPASTSEAEEKPVSSVPAAESEASGNGEGGSEVTGEWPEPATSEGAGGTKRKRRRKKKGGQGGEGGGQNGENGQGSAPQRGKHDPELVAKHAWKIYLAEISEEGVALVGDNDARELARRCFRLAEVFLDEQTRRR